MVKKCRKSPGGRNSVFWSAKHKQSLDFNNNLSVEYGSGGIKFRISTNSPANVANNIIIPLLLYCYQPNLLMYRRVIRLEPGANSTFRKII
jgi:hypothetical protein